MSRGDDDFLQLATPQAISCQLHPVSMCGAGAMLRAARPVPGASDACAVATQVVMFQVLDHHTRRNAEEGRVVGALLGSVQSDGTVALKNAFPMSHDDVTHGPQFQEFNHFFETMAALHNRVNAREQVIGWYTTTKASDTGKDDVAEDDVALHAFFEDKVGPSKPCIMLRVDSNIQKATKMGISAFVATNMALRPDKDAPPTLLGKCFAKVPCAVRSYEAERIGVDFITHNSIGEGGGEGAMSTV